MERLINGYKHFQSQIFPGKKDQFQLLSDRQAPEWLFITCSDSRVLPDLVLGTGPGDLFITRNAGNVVPVERHGGGRRDGNHRIRRRGAEGKEAILCGHSDCGAMKAALDRKGLENLPKARRWLSHVRGSFPPSPTAESCRRRTARNWPR